MRAVLRDLRRRVAWLLSPTVLVALAVAPSAFGATNFGSAGTLPGSTFEGGDAYLPGSQTAEFVNLLNNTDWAAPGTVAIRTLPDPQVSDDSFGGGNKETEPGSWFYVAQPGGVTPGKDNVYAAWAGAEGRFLYLSFYRAAPTGNTFLTFELNKAPADVRWTNSVGASVPCRQTGDVLVSYEVTPGGATDVDVHVYEWSSTTTHDTMQGGITYHCGVTGTFTTLPVDTSDVIASMNFGVDSDNVLDPDPADVTPAPATTPAGEFGEAAIDLAAVLGGTGDPCFSFGSFQVHSRSSVAIDSQLQDTLGPRPIVVRNCGVSGLKYDDLNGNGARDDGEPGLAGWTIYVDRNGDDAYEDGEPFAVSDETGAFTIGGVRPLGETSTFAVREVAPAGASSDWRCTEPGEESGCERIVQFTEGIATTDTGGDPVVFGNYLPAHITVVKDLVPAAGAEDDPGLFDLSLTQGEQTVASAADQGDGGGIARQEVVPGTYTIDEATGTSSPTPLAYYDSSISCGGGEDAAAADAAALPYDVTLAAGDDLVCTITNTRKAGHLSVVKHLTPAADSGRFDLLFLKGGEPVAETGAENVGDGGSAAADLAPGTYTVAEIAHSGTKLPRYATDISCRSEGGEGAVVASASNVSGATRGVEITLESGDDIACVITNVRIGPALTVTKTGPAHAYDGDALAYTITVGNSGSAPATDVALSDLFEGTTHGCDSLAGPDGDAGADSVLSPGETWTYTCNYKVVHADENSTHHVVDVVTATAIDPAGDPVGPMSASAATLVVHPAIAIDKAGPVSAEPGDKVAYLLAVTNPGDEAFAEATVVVTDPRCDASPVTLVTKNDDATPATLDPGDTWTYTCALTAPTAAPVVHNDATVVAQDQFGRAVTATDGVDTPLVLAEVFGSSRLQAPSGCVYRAFKARVLGTHIAKVRFYVDGKLKKTMTKPTKKVGLSQVFVLKINPLTLKVGVHRVIAKATYEAATSNNPKTVTYRHSFQHCKKQLIKPVFTG